jgi:hypothetical protein
VFRNGGVVILFLFPHVFVAGLLNSLTYVPAHERDGGLRGLGDEFERAVLAELRDLDPGARVPGDPKAVVWNGTSYIT